MLDERKEKMIDMLMQGESVKDTAKIVGIARQTVYDWLNTQEVKNELDRRRHEIISKANNLILNKLSTCTDELLRIALHGKSEKVRCDAACYVLNRAMGTPTNKIQQSTNDNKDDTSESLVLDAIKKEKNTNEPKKGK